MHQAKDNPVLVHPEEDWEAKVPVGADNKRNLAASGDEISGDVDAVFADCAYVVDETYHTKANQQCMMETFPALLLYGLLWKTECIDFHTDPLSCTEGVVGRALGIPSSGRVRVIKPRIRRRFWRTKQTAVCRRYVLHWLPGSQDVLPKSFIPDIDP